MKSSYKNETLILFLTVEKKITALRIFPEVRKIPPKLQLHLEALQECFQLATVLLCQLLSHLHLFSQSIMKYCNLFMKCSGSSWLKNLTTGKKKEKKEAFCSILQKTSV